jgi:hypothetical protein
MIKHALTYKIDLMYDIIRICIHNSLKYCDYFTILALMLFTFTL